MTNNISKENEGIHMEIEDTQVEFSDSTIIPKPDIEAGEIQDTEEEGCVNI